MSQPERVGPILKGLLNSLGIERQLREVQALTYWGEVVGKRIASRTKPKRVKASKLFVEVGSSAWMNELTFLKPMILTKLNQKIGGQIIQDIHFTLKRE